MTRSTGYTEVDDCRSPLDHRYIDVPLIQTQIHGALPHRILACGGLAMLVGATGGDALLRRMYRVYSANSCAIQRYSPLPWNGRILLVRAEASEEGYGGLPAGGWEDLASAVEVVSIPGDHSTVLGPTYIGRLAAVLRDELGMRPSQI